MEVEHSVSLAFASKHVEFITKLDYEHTYILYSKYFYKWNMINDVTEEKIVIVSDKRNIIAKRVTVV
jgi:hypothetical protein